MESSHAAVPITKKYCQCDCHNLPSHSLLQFRETTKTGSPAREFDELAAEALAEAC